MIGSWCKSWYIWGCIFARDYTRKSEIASPNLNERLFERHLRKLSKMDLRGKWKQNLDNLKMKVKVRFLVHLVMPKRVQTEQRYICLMCVWWYSLLQDLYKDEKKRAPEIWIKGALQGALVLHLFMQLSIHKSVQNDSVEGEIEEVIYAALEGSSKISLRSN